MKKVNKKMLIRGILLLILAAAIGISRFVFFSQNNHGLLKPILVIGICVVAGLVHIVMAVRTHGEIKEMEDEQ